MACSFLLREEIPACWLGLNLGGWPLVAVIDIVWNLPREQDIYGNAEGLRIIGCSV